SPGFQPSRAAHSTARSTSARSITRIRAASLGTPEPALDRDGGLRRREREQAVEPALVDLVRDHEPLDLGRALPDPVDAQLAPQPLHRLLAHVAAAAEDLHAAVDDAVGRLGAAELDHR